VRQAQGAPRSPGEDRLAAWAGYSLAATIVAGAGFLVCLFVFVFTQGRDRLGSPLIPKPESQGIVAELAADLVRPAGTVFLVLAVVSAVVSRRLDRRRPQP
jgi:hypothetical protein